MRRVFAWLCVCVLTGCPQLGKPCSSDSDCTGGVCDTEFKVCVIGDAGTGGGAGDCASGCAEWQTCKPGGTCVNASVTILSPTPGAIFGGGNTATVVAHVTDWDGGVFPRSSIPASASAGVTAPAMLMATDAGFVGAFGLPNMAGTYTLTAGWPAAKASVDVVAQVCRSTCAEWEECAPSPSGGSCNDLGLTLAWSTPTEGQTYGRGATVPLAVTVSRADGGMFAKPLPLAVGGVEGSALQPGSLWTGSVTGGQTSGSVELIAGWRDGGPVTPARHFVIDATPPTLGLAVGPGPFQRDAVALPAILTSSEALSDAGLTFAGVAVEPSATDRCPAYNTTTNAAACFLLDLSKPELLGLDGGFPAVFAATDKYGNSSDGGATVQVTRVRWIASPSTDTVQALAVGSNGALFAGINGSSGNTLQSLAPTTGTTGQSTAALVRVQSLAVAPGASNDIVYAAYDDSARGNIGAVNGDTLAVGTLFGPCQGAVSSATFSGISLFRVGTENIALGSINSVAAANGRICLYGPQSGGIPTIIAAQLDAPAVPSRVQTASNVVISGNTASFLQQGSSGANWQPVTLSGLSAPTLGTPELLNPLSSTPIGQAVSGGKSIFGAAAGLGNNSQLYIRPGAGNNNLGIANTDKGIPVIASATEAYIGNGNTFVRFNPANLSTSTPVTTVTDTFATSAVLGAPRTTGGPSEGYVISSTGTLVAFPQGTATAHLWTATLGIGSVVTHPTFDCNRLNPTSKTGILYIGSSTGKVAAIIVDSPKLLEGDGTWPKYQRSMGNAGNDDTTNFPTNWPCP